MSTSTSSTATTSTSALASTSSHAGSDDQVQQDAEEEEMSSSSSGCLSSESEADTKQLAAYLIDMGKGIQEDDLAPERECEPWCHRKSGTVHVRRRRATEEVVRFLCGRAVTEAFEPCTTWGR